MAFSIVVDGHNFINGARSTTKEKPIVRNNCLFLFYTTSSREKSELKGYMVTRSSVLNLFVLTTGKWVH
jgi:hypothetical protein